MQAAVYIKKEISERLLLSEAFDLDRARGTPDYQLVVVGHSLGAGTAAILAILLRQQFRPALLCVLATRGPHQRAVRRADQVVHHVTGCRQRRRVEVRRESPALMYGYSVVETCVMILQKDCLGKWKL